MSDGDLKPTWRGLTSGARTTPLREFVGRLERWAVETDSLGTVVAFYLQNVEVGSSDQPFPYAEARLAVKYSQALNSGWGKLGQSIAGVLNIPMDALDIELLVGQMLHLLRHDNVSYGQGRDGTEMRGTVWELVSLVKPAQKIPWKLTPAQLLPVVSASVPVATVSVVSAPALPVTPVERAKALLHGKTLAEFFQAALPDSVIRQDANLVNAILTNAFIQALLSSQEITQEGNTFKVKGMS